MDSVTRSWMPSVPNSATDLAARPVAASSSRLLALDSIRSSLLDADSLDHSQHLVVEDVVERAFVLFLEAFAQIFRRDKARFAIGQVAASALAKRHEPGVRQAHHDRSTINKKLRVDGVSMPCRDSVPHVREAALVDFAGELGGHLESADKRAHG